MKSSNFQIGEKAGDKIKKVLDEFNTKFIEKKIPKDNLRILLDYIQQYNNLHKSFPTIDSMQKGTGFSKSDIVSLLRKLENNGKVKRNYSKYSIKPDNKPTSTNVNSDGKFKITSKLVNNIFILIIGFICLLVSIFYLHMFFSLTNGIILSWLRAIGTAGFLVISFDLSIELKRRGYHLYSFLFISMFFIILMFSIHTTVSGQYTQYSEKKIEKILTNTNKDTIIFNNSIDSNLYQLYKTKEIKLNSDMQSRIKEKTRLENIILEFDTAEKQKENERTISKYKADIYYYNQELYKFQIELDNIQNSIKSLLEKNSITNTTYVDFFDWESKTLQIFPFLKWITSDILQLFFQLLPAIFSDIMAPLSISTVISFNKPKIKKN